MLSAVYCYQKARVPKWS